MPRAAKIALAVAGSLLGLFLIAFGASFVFNSADVPRGVTVAGVDIGGQDEAAARDDIRRALRDTLAGPVRLAVQGSDEVLELDPVTAGLSVDLDATLAEVKDAGPLSRVKGLFGASRQVEPQASVDDDALRAALRRLAAEFNRPLQPGTITFTGTTPTAVLPASGRTLDIDGAIEAITENWLEGQPVQVPGEVIEPEATPAQVRRVLAEVARPAVAGDLMLTTKAGPLVLTPADVASVLEFVPTEDGPLTPSVNGSVLLKRLGDRTEVVERAPADASFEIEDGEPVLVPARAGRSIRPTVLSAAVRAAIAQPDLTASLALDRELPEISNAKARSLGIEEEIGSFTTYFSCCPPRVTNIKRIAELTDGLLVLPGGSFDLNAEVGRRTRANGFVGAPQILNGEFVDAVGGGISQFATTMYNASFFAGMADVTHTPHSYYISRYPEGREATVSFPKPDLVWQNDSPNGVLITTRATDTSINVTLWGTERYDEVLSLSSGRSRITEPEVQRLPAGPACEASGGRNGFDITITRVLKIDGEEVKRDSDKHRYDPEPITVCVREPEPTPAPKPTRPPAPEPTRAPPAT